MKLNGKIQVCHLWAPPNDIGCEDKVSKMLMDIVDRIDMVPHGYVEIHRYPRKPDLGFTARVPIAFDAIQHLHESFIIYDNWVEHAYANLIVNSCKLYQSYDIHSVVRSSLDLKKWRLEAPIFYNGKD